MGIKQLHHEPTTNQYWGYHGIGKRWFWLNLYFPEMNVYCPKFTQTYATDQFFLLNAINCLPSMQFFNRSLLAGFSWLGTPYNVWVILPSLRFVSSYYLKGFALRYPHRADQLVRSKRSLNRDLTVDRHYRQSWKSPWAYSLIKMIASWVFLFWNLCPFFSRLR